MNFPKAVEIFGAARAKFLNRRCVGFGKGGPRDRRKNTAQIARTRGTVCRLKCTTCDSDIQDVCRVYKTCTACDCVGIVCAEGLVQRSRETRWTLCRRPLPAHRRAAVRGRRGEGVRGRRMNIKKCEYMTYMYDFLLKRDFYLKSNRSLQQRCTALIRQWASATRRLPERSRKILFLL